MDRTDLQQLSKEQLIELALQLQRPDKNSRTSSRPPSTDKKEKRENSHPGGAKPRHEPHNRWLVERTIAWLGRCRRLAEDWENVNRKALAFLRRASIRLMLRRFCNPI